jgi:two-component system chemotaxis response regulator CheY
MKILLVDDVDLERQFIRDTIEKLGHEVLGEAADGVTALRLFEVERPDLVFMDIDIPIMNGFDIIALMLEMDPKTRIVVITGMDVERDVVLKSGALGVMKKPLRVAKVEQMLRQVMAAFRNEKELRPGQLTEYVDDPE